MIPLFPVYYTLPTDWCREDYFSYLRTLFSWKASHKKLKHRKDK